MKRDMNVRYGVRTTLLAFLAFAVREPALAAAQSVPLDPNPLDDIRNLRKIRAVVLDGKRLDGRVSPV